MVHLVVQMSVLGCCIRAPSHATSQCMGSETDVQSAAFLWRRERSLLIEEEHAPYGSGAMSGTGHEQGPA